MNRILIIKLGALGDVIRTTPLLRALKGDITWVTQKSAVPLLRGNRRLSRIVDIEKVPPALKKNYYHLVLNLEEDARACELAMDLKKGDLVGPYASPSGLAYTVSSAEWFDMSLISRFGKKKADQIKWLNRRTYQEILFGMLGLKFKGEEYILPVAPAANPKSSRPRVGLETRSGERWVGKRWPHFPGFVDLLEDKNFRHVHFRESPTLAGFMRQINGTDAVVTTDSLALHIALGLKKKVVALFTCTSPQEIHGYGRAVKIVSPLLKKYYYSTEKTLKSGEAIPPRTVFKALTGLMR